MLREILLLLLISFQFLPAAQNDAYIVKHSNEIAIGNGYMERIISTSPDNTGTTEIINKLSGKRYKVKSEVFTLQIVFSGLGPAYGKDQNGENPVILTVKDFKFKGYDQIDLRGGGKKLLLYYNFDWDNTALRLIVNFEIYPGRFSLRKWIEVADSSEGIQFLDKIYVESMTFGDKDFSHGKFGQPVLNDDIFLGVEYPTVENEITEGKVRIGYVVGKEIKKSPFISYTSITGASPSKIKLEQTFMDYADSIKVNGTRPYLLYNSWYDFRNPLIVKDSSSIMNEKNVLNRIATFKKYMYNKYDIALNAFVLDDGWDNYRSMWSIDSTRFPEGFTPLVKALKPMQTDLGIWASPICGYSNRNLRINWGAEHGYEKTGDFLCFAGTNYKAAYKKVMSDYSEGYDIGYFKWDGFLLSCNETNHGHLPGIYSREANVSTYIDIINAVRKINPNIYLNITTGTWLSPWWLKYADCIWMQGEDYAYAEDVPSINDRDKSITYRDAVLWDDYQRLHLLFPMSSLMTHGIIKGRLNFLGGSNESLDSFSNEVMMYFGRGVMMWELYVSPDLLSDDEWNAIASSVKWAKANKEILEKTKMILGNPLKKEVYGYIHLRKEKGILLLRNPDAYKVTVNIKLTPDLGDIDPSTSYYVKVIYPYNLILPEPVRMNGNLKIGLDGYQVLTAELIPSDKIDKDLPSGVKYSIEGDKLTLYGIPGENKTIESLGRERLQSRGFGEAAEKLKYDDDNPAENNGNEFVSRVNINVPGNYKNTKFGFLLESNEKLQKQLKPDFEIKINGAGQKLTIEEEHGKWFWVYAVMNQGENKVEYSIKFKQKEKGKISSWIISDEELAKAAVDKMLYKDNELLPAKPYPAYIQKEIVSIRKFVIE